MRFDDGVTIAIPNWNHEFLLPRAIRSALRTLALLRASGVPGEVLIIDDNSRDGSVGMLAGLEARYHKDGLKVLAFAKNAGLPAGRNQALAHARYKYIAFVDADNELLPENFPTLLTTLRHTGAAAAYGTLLMRCVTWQTAHHAVSSEPFQDKAFDNNYIDAFAVFDRAQLVDLGGYDHSYQTWEDYEMWLRLVTNGREMVFVPTITGYYYILPTSMTVDPNLTRRVAGVHNKLKRTFNQVQARPHLPLRTRHRRYHPELGYF